jgi:FkbM family methyltransferase
MNRSLIYDVGMHKGDDTAFYLDKGFSVIAFEANPDLCEFCRDKFHEYIEQSKLIIVEGAVLDIRSPDTGQDKVRFFKNRNVSAWGTICEHLALRNERLRSHSQAIEVKALDFTKCLQENGIPYYMKIDIEGADIQCLKALLKFSQRPDYVSIESDKVSFANLIEEFNLLEELGYKEFKAIAQHNVGFQVPPNPPREGSYSSRPGDSGLFGKELDNEWKNRNAILLEYQKIYESYTVDCVSQWYDTHARHSSVDIP